MSNIKTAFVTFFPIVPNNMGSSAVVNDRFKSWPKNKKIFQLTHLKNVQNDKINSILISKETPINKIIKLPELIYKIYLYLRFSKNKLVIVEGASWIFYSFITIIFLKFMLINCKIIYISHSIESEIRKEYSNRLIYFLTKFLENLVYKISDYSTAVSIKEKEKIFKLYKKKTKLYPNAININEKNIKKKFKLDYIFYSGSYLYKPNKDAIDYLNKKIMPKIRKKFPQLKLVLTGGGFNGSFPWLIDKGIVSKKKLYNLIYNAKCICVPLKFGSGTRIKILEALILGTIVISTNKGIEGIEINKKNPPFVVNNKNKIIKALTFVLKNYKQLKRISNKNKFFYKDKYSMKNITDNFINSNLTEYFNEISNL